MASDERKLATSTLIPLEIDPASILSLSKGIIFDTIVHNVEYTLNNRRTEPLPWKLIGMSLICDSSRNKKYMQKLQKMQCVPSVICTQIFHSKLVKTESGTLATPGRKIVIPTTGIRKRLTGIIVCRSIDELLFMESSNTENVHFIQYKLLSYERIATRELVNGPKLPSVGEKVIKTVFDFEITQNNGFPRQLLPVAIVSFARQNGCDLCSSIRNFLKLDEHKTFDKSYLVTSTNTELDRLREEQERQEDAEAEAEQELIWDKIQSRQPLADVSKKSTDTGNARPTSIPEPSLRVPPLKIKLARPEKPLKPTVPIPAVDLKFRCALKLDRVDLSIYDISNLPAPSNQKKPNGSSTSSSDSINNKTKSFNITKPHEHHKPLKRLNNSEAKKQSPSLPSVFSKEKRDDELLSIRSSTSDIDILLKKDKVNKRSTSISSMSPMYQPKTTNQTRTVEKTIIKKKFKRPVLPSEYHCSLLLSAIDLSMYNIDLPATVTSPSAIPMDIELTLIVSPSSSTSSEQQTESTNVPVELENIQGDIQSMPIIEPENVHEPEDEIMCDTQQYDDANTNVISPTNIEEYLTPEMNEPLSTTNNDIPSPSTDEVLLQTTNEPVSTLTDEALLLSVSQVIEKIVAEVSGELLAIISDESIPETINEDISTISNEEDARSMSFNSYTGFSPELPQLDDDPVFFSIDSSQGPVADTSDSFPQGYIIIVPCSDDDDDDDFNDNKIVESISSPVKQNTSPVLLNPSLTRVLKSASSLSSHRSSTSSSCSSISTSILHNQSPRTPLHLIEILVPQKFLNKLPQSIVFNRFNLCIPLLTHEPLIDPRLIYRLQAITTDLRWPSPCNQCSIAPHLPPLFTSSTQMISYDRKCSSDFVDPRRESLKNAILDNIYQRIKILIPNIFIINSNQFQKLLFEQTIFTTNCSLHLEYLLHKIKINDDMNFFHMIKNNDEFQLSPFLLQLIFN